MVTDSVDAIIKSCPVLYIYNNRVNCFINLHKFVFSPGVFEVLLFLPKEQQKEFETLLEQNPETTAKCETFSKELKEASNQ